MVGTCAIRASTEHLFVGTQVESGRAGFCWQHKQLFWDSGQSVWGRGYSKRLKRAGTACPVARRTQWGHQHQGPATALTLVRPVVRPIRICCQSGIVMSKYFKVEASTQVENWEWSDPTRSKVGSYASRDTPNDSAALSPRIIAIGIGTAGGKMLDHMGAFLLQQNADLWAMNTDAQALKASGAPHHLQLGAELMQGLGTGGDSRAGAEAAAASSASIERVLGGRLGVCYVVCGAGGGTGGGASPLVLRAAKGAGHLAVAVVTLPFRFEGPRRMRQARATVEALHEAADVVIAIDQDAFLQHHQNLSMTQAASLAADMALNITRGITHLLQVEPALEDGSKSDLPGTMKLLRASGRAVVGCGQGRTAQRAVEAAMRAPGVGSLHMFAAHVLCVLSSSLPLGPRDVESATKSIAAVTSNRHGQPIVVRHLDKAASVEGGLAATIVLAGLPREFSDAAAPSSSAEGPSHSGATSKAQTVPAGKTIQRNTLVNTAEKRAAEQSERPRDIETRSSEAPTSTGVKVVEQTKAVALGRSREPQAKNGVKQSVKAPPPQSLTTGRGEKETGGAKEQQQQQSNGGFGLLETDSHSLQRRQTVAGEEQGVASSGSAVGREEPVRQSPTSPQGHASSSGEVQNEGGQLRGAQASSSGEVQNEGGPLRGAQERASAERRRQTGSGAAQGSTNSGRVSERLNSTDSTTRLQEPADATAESSRRHSTGDGVQGAGQEAAVQQRGVQGKVGHVPLAGAQNGGSPQVELRPGLKKQDLDETKRVSKQAEAVSAQYSRAALANAAALQWWQEVVEAQAETWGEEGEEDREEEQGARAGPGSTALSVSARARSILERERSQEQYRVVAVKQVLPDGSLYEGHLGTQGPHGQGTCVYPWGDVYEGAWRQGERHGQGKLTEKSGDVYEGSWRRGHRHGKGRVAYANGHVLTAYFVDGHVHGPAIIAFAHGTTFYGAFRFNRRQGVAMTVDAEGQRTWEVWDHGQRIS